MVENATGSLEATSRHLGLKNLAMKMWQRDASVGEVEWRASLLVEAQAVEAEFEEADEFSRDGPGFAAAVCVRDHLDELDDVDFEWCARRIDLEVRRQAETVELTVRLGKNNLRADRVCASVVPLLAVDSRKAEGVDSIALLSVSLTHPVDEVVEYAYTGLRLLVGDGHKALVLQCVAAAAYWSRLTQRARETMRERRVAAVHDDSDTHESVVPTVRRVIEEGSLNPADELRRLDLDDPGVGAAFKAVLAVFEHRRDWEESRDFYSRVSQWLVDVWRDDARSDGRTARNFELEGEALRSLARFALRLPGAEAMRISGPVVGAVADQRREIEDFVSELIMSADRSTEDRFWEIWAAVG